MLRFFVSAFFATTLAYEGATYLLWLYENRVHGRWSWRGPRLPYVTSWLGDWAALVFLLCAFPLGWAASSIATSAESSRAARLRTGSSRPVLLVHGWCLTRGAMALLAARLRRDGREVYTVRYPSTAADVEVSASALVSTIHRLAAGGEAGPTLVDVVAHGRGGVVVRAAARQGCSELLGNIVTLGCPHQGSALAAMLGGRHMAQLQPHSTYLARLNSETEVDVGSQWTSIYSSFDAVVFPTELAYHPGALNIGIDWIGHHALLVSGRVYALAKENLDAHPHG